MYRLLNGLEQMEGSETYSYEYQILGDAMRLFCLYYMDQVEEALAVQTASEKKGEIIEDIEDAISKISNVYKNVIDSTSNSDRQLFTSHAVETSIYDISPKLFATYSMILKTLAALFDKQDLYTFLLHPSLKSNVETVSLFDMRQRPGKVVLIYIPENKIEKLAQIPFYFFHEAFHVLTKEERCRKERACKMQIHMTNMILQRLFQNVSFGCSDGSEEEKTETDTEIKTELMKRWFKTEEWIAELRGREENDRTLYGKNVIAETCMNWRTALESIFERLGSDLSEVLAEKNSSQYKKPYKMLVQVNWEIQKNLVGILANSDVERHATAYMQVYREAYADIAGILTGGFSPETYEEAFQESMAETVDDDTLRDIRIYTVAKAVADCEGFIYVEEWKKYCDKHDLKKQEESQNAEKGLDRDAILEEPQRKSGKAWSWETDINSLTIVFEECRKKLWGKLEREKCFFEKFRTILEELDMINILSGATNQELMDLKKSVKKSEKTEMPDI